MKLQTFEEFLNESKLNEGKTWFKGSDINMEGADESSDYDKFLKKAKTGDTFAVDGDDDTEFLYISSNDFAKNNFNNVKYKSASGYNATVIDAKQITIKPEDQPKPYSTYAIFFTLKEEPSIIYIAIPA